MQQEKILIFNLQPVLHSHSECDPLSVVYVHNANGVGEAGALLPASDDNHRVAWLQEATFLTELHTVLDTSIDVLQPVIQGGF